MIFNSLPFLIFLPIVFIVYWSLKNKPIIYQNTILLIASYFFYGWWDWRFLALIAFSTIIDFILGKKIDIEKVIKKRKRYLYLS